MPSRTPATRQPEASLFGLASPLASPEHRFKTLPAVYRDPGERRCTIGSLGSVLDSLRKDRRNLDEHRSGPAWTQTEAAGAQRQSILPSRPARTQKRPRRTWAFAVCLRLGLEDKPPEELQLTGAIDDVRRARRRHKRRRGRGQRTQASVAPTGGSRSQRADAAAASRCRRVLHNRRVHREDVAVIGQVEGLGCKLQVEAVDGKLAGKPSVQVVNTRSGKAIASGNEIGHASTRTRRKDRVRYARVRVDRQSRRPQCTTGDRRDAAADGGR